MTRSFRPHLVWGLLGAVAVPSLWYAWSVPGAAAMFACIGLAFVFWYRMGQRGSWMALVLMGAGMSGLLAWQAATGSRCPEGDTRVFLKPNKPPIGCTDVRASAGAMSVFFGMVALIGLGAPLYARSMRDDEDHAAGDDEPIAG